MPARSILVVARRSSDRQEMADALLLANHLVFCACDASEVIDFELSGLTWSVVVFGGPAGAWDAQEYLRRSAEARPIVVVRAPDTDFARAREPAGNANATVASLVQVVEKALHSA